MMRFGDANFVSAYWTRTNDPEVDLVGHDDDRRPQHVEFVGPIKWRETASFSHEYAAQLATIRPRVPLAGNATLLVGVSKNGFSPHAKLDVCPARRRARQALSSR